MVRFSTTLKGTGPTTTGIVVADAVLAKFSSSRRPALTVTVNGYRYRTTVGMMGGVAMLPFSAEQRKASGLNAGDAIEVELALDTAERAIEIPDDLRTTLDAHKAIRAAFDKLAPSRRKAEVDSVVSAKSPETRARRIAAIVERLARLTAKFKSLRAVGHVRLASRNSLWNLTNRAATPNDLRLCHTSSTGSPPLSRNRCGKAVVGDGFSAIGRFAQSGREDWYYCRFVTRCTMR